MKAKPICVIYLPSENELSISAGGKILYPSDLMNILNGWGDGYEVDKKLDEYIWFSFWKPDITTPEFKVFYSKDFTEIQYQELKQLVEDSLKQNKP
jgi:hypothetical protein